MLRELDFGEIAGGNGKYTSIDGLGAMDVGGGVTDDKNFRWAQVGELSLGGFKCGLRNFVTIFGAVAKRTKFKSMPEMVMGEFEFRT